MGERNHSRLARFKRRCRLPPGCHRRTAPACYRPGNAGAVKFRIDLLDFSKSPDKVSLCSRAVLVCGFRDGIFSYGKLKSFPEPGPTGESGMRQSFEDRLGQELRRTKEQAEKLEPGPERNAL